MSTAAEMTAAFLDRIAVHQLKPGQAALIVVETPEHMPWQPGSEPYEAVVQALIGTQDRLRDDGVRATIVVMPHGYKTADVTEQIAALGGAAAANVAPASNIP